MQPVSDGRLALNRIFFVWTTQKVTIGKCTTQMLVLIVETRLIPRRIRSDTVLNLYRNRILQSFQFQVFFFVGYRKSLSSSPSIFLCKFWCESLILLKLYCWQTSCTRIFVFLSSFTFSTFREFHSVDYKKLYTKIQMLRFKACWTLPHTPSLLSMVRRWVVHVTQD